MTNVLKYTLLIVTVYFPSQAFAFSESLDDDVSNYIDFLSDTNLYSPLEGAGSHGSIGLGLGVGASSHTFPKNRALLNDQWRDRQDFSNSQPQDHSGQFTLPRAYIHKGFSIPVDVGATFAMIPDTNASSAGAYMQWTIFEAFALPAIAVRGKYARLMGLPSTEFDSIGADVTASYGFLRLFNVYGTFGSNRHTTLIRTSGETGTALSLTSDNKDELKDTRQSQASSVGIQLLLLPIFSTITVENRRQGPQQSWLAKLSVGI